MRETLHKQIGREAAAASRRKPKAIPDESVRPGMIVTMREAPGEKYEVLEANGADKILLRREDLE